MFIIADFTRSGQRFSIDENKIYPCTRCEDGELKPFDYCKRILRHEGGDSEWCQIPRHKCDNPACEFTSRMLPVIFVPMKHYGSEEISDVVSGKVQPDDGRTDEYPCIGTMLLWLEWFSANLSYIEAMIRSIANRRLGFSDIILESETSIVEGLQLRFPDTWLGMLHQYIYNAGGSLRPLKSFH